MGAFRKETQPLDLETALSECRRLAEHKLWLEREWEHNEFLLREAWSRVPEMPVRKWRPCRICGKPTLARVGEDRPQCADKHTRETALDILQGNL